MMIKCSKCGFENQMGAIFCRSCGEKIDMDAVNPEKMAKEKTKKERGGKVIKAVRNLIGLILLLAIAGAIAAFLIPIENSSEEPSEDALKKVTPKIELLCLSDGEIFTGKKKMAILPKPMKFSMDEINAVFNKRFMKNDKSKEENTFSYSVESIHFAVNDNKNIKVTVHFKFLDVIPVDMQITGMPKYGDETNPVSFDIEHAQCGCVPMDHELLRKVIVDKFAALQAIPELRNIFTITDTITLKDEALIFSFRNSRSYKAPEKAAAPAKKEKTGKTGSSGKSSFSLGRKNSK